MWSRVDFHILLRFATATLLVAGLSSVAQAGPKAGLWFPAPLAKDVASLPRIIGKSAAIAKVNALLAQRDAEVGERQTEIATGPCTFHERTVSVAYSGPRFLSIVEVDSGYCEGAAHPWYDQDYLTFDIISGTQIDGATFLPIGYGHLHPATTRLKTLYQSAHSSKLPDECLEVLTQDQANAMLSFAVWLDADRHALGISPIGLAYAFTACEDPAYIPLSRLKDLGFGSYLIEALTGVNP